MFDSSKFSMHFSRIVLVGAVLANSLLASPASSQTRGFPSGSAEPILAVGTVLMHWQAIQDDLRSVVGPQRRPEFDFRMLSPELPGASGRLNGENNLEKFAANQLPKRIILVLGGLQGTTSAAEYFAMELSHALHDPINSRMAVFGYPNDGSICESASVLHEMLMELHRQSPATRVSIVAHSMGGLVARHAIEPIAPKTGCQLPCVDQLVMLCPPNHGSVLAQYADALELHDALVKLQSGSYSFTQVLKSLVNDGLGEACEELVPTSSFLRELNNRPRADGVRYSIIAGTGGPVTPLVRFASSVAFNETRQRTRISHLPNAKDALNRVDELLLSDEFARGLGDGAVSLQSAALPGVHEFVTVPLNHGEWAQTDKPQVQQLVQQTAQLLHRNQEPAVAPPVAPPRAKF